MAAPAAGGPAQLSDDEAADAMPRSASCPDELDESGCDFKQVAQTTKLQHRQRAATMRMLTRSAPLQLKETPTELLSPQGLLPNLAGRARSSGGDREQTPQPMDPEEWAHLQALLFEALKAMAPEERQAATTALAQRCSQDAGSQASGDGSSRADQSRQSTRPLEQMIAHAAMQPGDSGQSTPEQTTPLVTHLSGAAGLPHRADNALPVSRQHSSPPPNLLTTSTSDLGMTVGGGGGGVFSSSQLNLAAGSLQVQEHPSQPGSPPPASPPPPPLQQDTPVMGLVQGHESQFMQGGQEQQAPYMQTPQTAGPPPLQGSPHADSWGGTPPGFAQYAALGPGPLGHGALGPPGLGPTSVQDASGHAGHMMAEVHMQQHMQLQNAQQMEMQRLLMQQHQSSFVNPPPGMGPQHSSPPGSGSGTTLLPVPTGLFGQQPQQHQHQMMQHSQPPQPPAPPPPPPPQRMQHQQQPQPQHQQQPQQPQHQQQQLGHREELLTPDFGGRGGGQPPPRQHYGSPARPGGHAAAAAAAAAHSLRSGDNQLRKPKRGTKQRDAQSPSFSGTSNGSDPPQLGPPAASPGVFVDSPPPPTLCLSAGSEAVSLTGSPGRPHVSPSGPAGTQISSEERLLINLTEGCLLDKAANPYLGSLPVVVVQRTVLAKAPEAYESVVGSKYDKSFHSFVRNHRQFRVFHYDAEVIKKWKLSHCSPDEGRITFSDISNRTLTQKDGETARWKTRLWEDAVCAVEAIIRQEPLQMRTLMQRFKDSDTEHRFTEVLPSNHAFRRLLRDNSDRLIVAGDALIKVPEQLTDEEWEMVRSRQARSSEKQKQLQAQGHAQQQQPQQAQGARRRPG